jgi:fructose-1-phosphate kinase PfkB-like protein
MIVSIALSPSVDVTYVVDGFAEGSQNRPVSVHRVAGGKAVNMARAAVTIGGDATVLAVLGGSAGRFIRSELDREQVTLLAVDGLEETRSCVSVFSRSSGLLTEIYEQPTPLGSAEWQGVLDSLSAALAERPGWVSVSGGVPGGVPTDALGRLARLAGEAGARVAIDSHGEPLSLALAARPALVKVNRGEAMELLGAAPSHPVADLARAIRERTGGAVVVTDGTNGSVGVDGPVIEGSGVDGSGTDGSDTDDSGTDGRAFRVTIPGVTGGFPVGSGDAYLGGMVTTLDRGGSLEEAMRVGAACGAANALVPGAAVFDAASVERLLPQVVVTRID